MAGPANAPGAGAIAIVELGGGWNRADVTAAFAAMGLPAPSITDVSVDGTKNTPGGDADGEVALDIQVAGGAFAVATGRPANIRIYWAQNIAEAVHRASVDGCSVCSISWGAPEESWGKPACQDMNDTAMVAGSCRHGGVRRGRRQRRGRWQFQPSVDCPACCPHIIGCGGTSISVGGSEAVWNNNPGRANGEGTGGGFSVYFPRQTWQLGRLSPKGLGRMVPDVAANADPDTGYNIVLDGQAQVGGTSAVAPLYAGLFAAFGTKLGWMAPILWRLPLCFNDITIGDNGAFRAARGPDACTGLGSPIADRLATMLAHEVQARNLPPIAAKTPVASQEPAAPNASVATSPAGGVAG